MPVVRPVLFSSRCLRVCVLALQEDLPLVETLCGRCSDYYRLVHGEPPNIGEARQVFEDAPPGRTPADKLVLGLLDPAERLVGVIEVVCGYRETCDWYIGLMLLDPAARGQGAGSALHGEFVHWARTRGVTRLLLAVVEENGRARRFWQALGYRRSKVFLPRTLGRKMHALEEMELSLEN